MHLYSKIVDLRKIQLIFLAATDIENCFSRSSSWLFSKAIKIRYFYKWIFFKKCELVSYSDVCKMRTSDKNIQNILEWEFCWFTELLRNFYGSLRNFFFCRKFMILDRDSFVQTKRKNLLRPFEAPQRSVKIKI